MSTLLPDIRPQEDPQGQLEHSFIEEYIRLRGYDPTKIHCLPEDQRHLLLKEASVHAAMRLADVDSKAHYIHEIHGER